MAEIFSDAYDIFHPTPVSLKKLAAMAVSLQVWRCERKEHRTSDSDILEDFWPSLDYISLKPMFIGIVPSVIAKMIEEYAKNFAHSIPYWLNVYYFKIFHFHYNYETYLYNLKKFDKFVCDYNGTVHHEKTAKHMIDLDNDVLSQTEKFEIACMYFFKDDIERLWPSVGEKMDLNLINFDENPELYYWICCLKKELEKVPTIEDYSVDERMLSKCVTNNSRQLVQYFWDRIPLERRMRTAVDCFRTSKQSFVRFILPKLDKEQLAEFVDEKGVYLMNYLLQDRRSDETLVLSTWMYIRNVMNVSQITDLVVGMLKMECNIMVDYDKIENWVRLCYKILNNLSPDLKLSIIRTILSNDNNVSVERILSSAVPGFCRSIKFLLGILLCVTVEERNVFWQNYWHILIWSTRCKDLKRIVDVSFEDEEKIAQFKEKIIAKNEKVRDICVWLLNRRFFDQVNEVVSFCYSDTGKARGFKQGLLQSVFFGENCCFSIEFLFVFKEFNAFIDDAYENADLSTDFKNKLMSLPAIQFRLSQYACQLICRKELMEFIDILVPKEQSTLMQQIKNAIIIATKKKIIGNRDSTCSSYTSWLKGPACRPFLLWCLESEAEVVKFEQRYILSSGCLQHEKSTNSRKLVRNLKMTQNSTKNCSKCTKFRKFTKFVRNFVRI